MTIDGSTIAAISSPPGGGRRGVVRLSGPRTADVLAGCVRLAAPGGWRALDPASDLGARCALRVRLDDGRGTQPALLLWMPGPRSSTREDVAELHLPGAEPLLAAALARVLSRGARAAEPGEFTRRAFLNGRIDLSRAEGVLELTRAGSEAERRAGALLLAGGLSGRAAVLRDHLEELRALSEASLDFDEAEAGHVPTAELLARLAAIEGELRAAHAWERERQPPPTLPRVVLSGAPNAGKSSLFNALVAGGEALTSELAGTTRDFLVGLWPLGPLDALLIDTPGRDPGARGADAEAQRLAARERSAADLVLELVEPRAPRPAEEAGGARLVVGSKSDLREAEAEGLSVSARTGAGLGELAAAVRRALGAEGDEGEGDGAGGSWAVSREVFARHREALEGAGAALGRAREAIVGGAPLDQVAEELRAAGVALEGIEGRTTAEGILDRIFARFCLGK